MQKAATELTRLWDTARERPEVSSETTQRLMERYLLSYITSLGAQSWMAGLIQPGYADDLLRMGIDWEADVRRCVDEYPRPRRGMSLRGHLSAVEWFMRRYANRQALNTLLGRPRGGYLRGRWHHAGNRG